MIISNWHLYKSDFGDEIYHLCKKGEQMSITTNVDGPTHLGSTECDRCKAKIDWYVDSVNEIYPVEPM